AGCRRASGDRSIRSCCRVLAAISPRFGLSKTWTDYGGGKRVPKDSRFPGAGACLAALCACASTIRPRRSALGRYGVRPEIVRRFPYAVERSGWRPVDFEQSPARVQFGARDQVTINLKLAGSRESGVARKSISEHKLVINGARMCCHVASVQDAVERS